MQENCHSMQESFLFCQISIGEKFKVVIGDNIQSLEQKTQSNFDIEMKFLHGELLSKTPTSNWGNDR